MRFSHLFTALATASVFSLSAQAGPLVYPTGTTQYDPAKAQNGYTLVGGQWNNSNAVDVRQSTVKNKQGRWTTQTGVERKLVDMNGNVVHVWKNAPGERYRILPSGNLLTVDQQGKKVVEYDWDGNIVWEFQSNLGPHHDAHRLDNGNTLILTFENVPVEKLAQVKDHEDQWFGKYKRQGELLIGDSIIEVTPDKRIVWQWNSSDHLDLNRFNPQLPATDWTHANTAVIIPENKWYDAGDKRFKPGNIIFNARHFDEVMIIDKESGNVVWSWTTKKFGGLGNAHDPSMIAKGLPGEGNMLIYDNGLLAKTNQHAGRSVLHEFNPSTGEIVWSYISAIPSPRFYSQVMSTVIKLPNGNVLTSEDTSGRVLQIAPDAEHPDGGLIVWEYVNDGNVARPTWYPYDYTPQMKALPKPVEMKVSPVEPATWRILPDEKRKDGVFVEKVK